MVTATPTTVGDVARTLLDQAITEAAQQPTELANLFQQLGKDATTIVDQVEQLPGDVLPTLQSPPFSPPDWWSLLVFLMARLVASAHDPHLSLGYRHPAGWSRMLTLTYSADLDGSVAATVGVAIADPGVTHGIWLQVLEDFTFTTAIGALSLHVTGSGQADFTYSPGATTALPDRNGSIDIDLSWAPWNSDLDLAGGGFTFTMGPLHLHLTLTTPANPLYTMSLGLGAVTTPGVAATLDVGKALGSTLASFITISPIDESYSPQLILTQGGAPRFSLGHDGID
jgi:hypothetical protein